jgi:dihydrodipicolinate synthase/N-acetylneuraminate lyase
MNPMLTRRVLLQGMALGAAAIALPGALLQAAGADKRFRGLFPIGATPVDASDKVDFAQLGGQVTFLRRARVPGIAWPQIASGWTVLSEAERLQGAEALVAAAKGGETAVVIGVQSPDLAAVKRYAAHAGRIGADAIICIPPETVTDEAALLAYYQQVGKLTHLPLFVQAVGKMSVDLLVRMYETIPTMRYVKDESGEPLERVQELLKRTKGEVADFSGRGANTLVTEMERGFIGACPFMSLPDVYQGAWEAWEAGDKAKAFQIFGAIQAANTMFSQSAVETMIARGLFTPGTTLRAAPAAAGASTGRYLPARSVEEIRRVLDTYLRPYLRV